MSDSAQPCTPPRTSSSAHATRFFLTPTVFSWLIIFCKKQQKEAVRWFWRTRAICRPRFCYRFIKTVVTPLVSTTGSVNCWTKLKYCSNWCLEVLWYSDTMYMLFEKIKLIGFMRIKSTEKCAQRIRRFLKISQKIGSKRWFLPSFFENLGWYLRDFIQLDLHSDIHHFSCWEQDFLLFVIS